MLAQIHLSLSRTHTLKSKCNFHIFFPYLTTQQQLQHRPTNQIAQYRFQLPSSTIQLRCQVSLSHDDDIDDDDNTTVIARGSINRKTTINTVHDNNNSNTLLAGPGTTTRLKNLLFGMPEKKGSQNLDKTKSPVCQSIAQLWFHHHDSP